MEKSVSKKDFLKAFEELRIVLIMVGIAVLTFSTLLFFAEKDSEQFDWTWSEVLLWGIVTLSTGKKSTYSLF